MSSSDIKKLKEKLLKEAKESTGGVFWIPQEEGEYLFGKVIRMRKVRVRLRSGEKEVDAVDIHSLDDDMIYTVLMTHKVLASLWESKNVQPGDIVLIMYKGAVKDSSGDVKYHLYGLGVEHVSGESVSVPEVLIEEEKPAIVEEEKPKVEEKQAQAPTTVETVVEKKEPTDKERDLIIRASEFLLNMLEFYGELTFDEAKQLLSTKGQQVNLDAVIEKLGNKIRVEGNKIVLAQ